MPALSREELEREVRAVPTWFHPIDLGQGVIAPGGKGSPELLAAETAALQIPSLAGKSVLDIGAWDGYYSFYAERQGAARVVALDHFSWEREALGGGKGFDLAHRVLESKVEKVHADWEHIDASTVGQFDVVFFFGVLYHLEDPVGGMRQLLQYVKPGGLAVVETEAVSLTGHEKRPVAEYFPGAELNNDDTNYWSPNLAAVLAMARAVGFSQTQTIKGPPLTARLRPVGRYRAIVHAQR